MSPLVQNQTPQPPRLSFLSPLVYNPNPHPPVLPPVFFSSCEEGTGKAAMGLSAWARGWTLNLQLRWAVVAISSCCWQCTEPSLHPFASTEAGDPGEGALLSYLGQERGDLILPSSHPKEGTSRCWAGNKTKTLGLRCRLRNTYFLAKYWALAWQAVLQAVLGEGTGDSAVRS